MHSPVCFYKHSFIYAAQIHAFITVERGQSLINVHSFTQHGLNICIGLTRSAYWLITLLTSTFLQSRDLLCSSLKTGSVLLEFRVRLSVTDVLSRIVLLCVPQVLVVKNNIVWASLVTHNVPSDFRGIPGKSCGAIIVKAEELGNCRVLWLIFSSLFSLLS